MATRPRGPRRRYHFGSPALVYMGVTLLLALGAFNSQNNLLFWALGFSFAALIVSGVLSGRMLMGMSAERRPVAAAHAGDVATIVYRVRNINRLTPTFALQIDERGLEVANGGTRGRPRSGRQRGSTDAPLVQTIRHGFAEYVAVRGQAEARAELLCLRRGVVRLAGFRVHTAFPFGLIRKSVDFDRPSELLIRPRLLPIEGNVLRRLASVGVVSVTGSRRAGMGDEYFAVREYAEGDSPRSIAWRASARRMSSLADSGDSGETVGTGLLVRQTASPMPRRVWVVVTGLVAGDEVGNEDALSVAASIVRAAIASGMSVGLSIPALEEVVRTAEGSGHAERVFDHLARLDLNRLGAGGGAVAAGFPTVAAAPGASCIVVHARAIRADFAPRGTHAVHVSGEVEASRFRDRSSGDGARPGAPSERPAPSTVGGKP